MVSTTVVSTFALSVVLTLVNSAVVPDSAATCDPSDIGCLAMIALELAASEDRRTDNCATDDLRCQRQQLVAQLQSMEKPYSQYIPVANGGSGLGSKSLRLEKVEKAAKDSTLKKGRYNALVARNKYPNFSRSLKRNRRATDTYCAQKNQTTATDTLQKCEYNLLVHRILYCSTYLYLDNDIKDQANRGGSGSPSDFIEFEHFSDSLLTYTDDGVDDDAKPDDYWWNVTELELYLDDDAEVANMTLAEYELISQEDHTIGVQSTCFANLVDLLIDEKLPTNNVDLPNPSFVCGAPEDYVGSTLTTYGRMSCDKAIATLMGMRPFSLDVTNLSISSCDKQLLNPVGEFFNDTIKLGELILSAGKQCCLYEALNPVCNDWDMFGSVNNCTAETDGADTFNWSDYWALYDHGEAWVVPIMELLIIIFILLVIKQIQKYKSETELQDDKLSEQYELKLAHQNSERAQKARHELIHGTPNIQAPNVRATSSC